MKDDTRALTGIRGVAAIWVMAGHYSGGFDSMPMSHFFSKCYLAVDLFFVLSGFVIALNHGQVFASAKPSDACFAFYHRRVVRIYPLLAVAMLVTLAWRAFVGMALPSPVSLLANLTMTHAWFSQDGIVGQSWSVSVETFAYLAFPWIAALVFRRSPLAAVWLVLAAWSCLSWMCTLDAATYFGELDPSGPLDIRDGGIYPILRCVCGFAAGIGAYRISGLPGVRAFLATPGLPEALLTAVVLLTWHTDLDLPIAVLFVVLVGALACPDHLASKALRSRPAMTLGNLSYAIYLSHMLVGTIVRDALAGTMTWGLVLVCCALATLAVSFALHTFVEKPCHACFRDRSQPLAVKSADPEVAAA